MVKLLLPLPLPHHPMGPEAFHSEIWNSQMTNQLTTWFPPNLKTTEKKKKYLWEQASEESRLLGVILYFWYSTFPQESKRGHETSVKERVALTL